jgi:lipopolysaccharide export system protein LptA
MPQASSVPQKLLQVSALLLLLAPVATWGLEADRSQPIHIEADKATLSDRGEKSTYEGNVQLRQGTLRLQGNHMTVYLANKQVDRIILTGEPATLQQRPNDKDADQHAQADSIEYSATDERVVLLGNARIWQTGDEEFRSERIVFNLKDNTVNAGGKDSQDRVRITLQPKSAPATDNKSSGP